MKDELKEGRKDMKFFVKVYTYAYIYIYNKTRKCIDIFMLCI
jgi:hypothetical protein